jgi:hypothetical protein
MKVNQGDLQRYKRRMTVVKKTIKMRVHASSGDLAAWNWIGSLLEILGPDGMSSDESDADAHGPILVAKKVPWRRDCEQFMEILDDERTNGGLFKKCGQLPERRVRRLDANDSDRKVPKGLPEALYKPEWVQSLDKKRKSLIYQPSKKLFEFKYYRRNR